MRSKIFKNTYDLHEGSRAIFWNDIVLPTINRVMRYPRLSKFIDVLVDCPKTGFVCFSDDFLAIWTPKIILLLTLLLLGCVNFENVQSSPVNITGTGFMCLLFWDAKIPQKIIMIKAVCVFMFHVMFLWPKFVHNWWHVDILVSLPGYVIWLVTPAFGGFCHEMWSIFL